MKITVVRTRIDEDQLVTIPPYIHALVYAASLHGHQVLATEADIAELAKYTQGALNLIVCDNHNRRCVSLNPIIIEISDCMSGPLPSSIYLHEESDFLWLQELLTTGVQKLTVAEYLWAKNRAHMIEGFVFLNERIIEHEKTRPVREQEED